MNITGKEIVDAGLITDGKTEKIQNKIMFLYETKFAKRSGYVCSKVVRMRQYEDSGFCLTTAPCTMQDIKSKKYTASGFGDEWNIQPLDYEEFARLQFSSCLRDLIK